MSEQFFQAHRLASCHQVATFLRLKLTVAVSFPPSVTPLKTCQLNLNQHRIRTMTNKFTRQTFSPLVRSSYRAQGGRLRRGGSGGRVYNFELSVAVRQVGGEDYQRKGEPRAARSHISGTSQCASDPRRRGLTSQTSGEAVRFWPAQGEEVTRSRVTRAETSWMEIGTTGGSNCHASRC